MKNRLLLTLIVAINAMIVYAQPPQDSIDIVIEKEEENQEFVLGLYSQVNEKQTYEECFLQIGGEMHYWKVDQEQPKVLWKMKIPAGIHPYSMVIKTQATVDGEKIFKMGTATGNLLIEKDANMKIKWENAIAEDIYKLSFVLMNE